MKTKTFDIGETRKAWLLSIEEYKGSTILVFVGDDSEGYIAMGHPKGDFKVNDQGTLTFTKGGPLGGYWHFTPDERPTPKTDYTREELIAICEQAVVPVDKWGNRDSPSSHEKLGLCMVMLKAGCEFWIHTSPPARSDNRCLTSDRTIWLGIDWPSFSTFEYGGGDMNSETFYLPTPERLKEREGRDWY